MTALSALAAVAPRLAADVSRVGCLQREGRPRTYEAAPRAAAAIAEYIALAPRLAAAVVLFNETLVMLDEETVQSETASALAPTDRERRSNLTAMNVNRETASWLRAKLAELDLAP